MRIATRGVAWTSLAPCAATVSGAGRSHPSTRARTDEHDQGRLRDATYPTVLAAIEPWLEGGGRPEADGFQPRSLTLGHACEDCRFE